MQHHPRDRFLIVALAVALVGVGGWGLGRRQVSAASPDTGMSDVTMEGMRIQQAFHEAAGRVLPATVKIQTNRGLGSGFIYDPKGLILTNAHVIAAATRIDVILPDRRQFRGAQLVGTDRASDVAVLRVNTPSPLPVAELGDSDDVQVGNWSIAIGSPMDLSQTVTVGVVSATGRRTGVTGNEYRDYIQTDAAINPGNSGGPLVNILGQVIGINNHILSESGDSAGIGFAVPINTAKAVANALVGNGRMLPSRLGLEMRDARPEEVNQYGNVGDGLPVVLTKVDPSGPAAQAGLQVGDVALALNGRALHGAQDMANRIQLLPAGAPATLSLWRAGQRVSLSVTPAAVQPTSDTKLGIEVQELTQQLAVRLGRPRLRGLLIVDVEENSAADDAGLHRGQIITAVNNEETPTASAFDAAWRRAAPKGQVFLTVNGRQVRIDL